MGQYDFSAQRVHHAATQLLSTSRLKHPPSWYNTLFDVPPPQLLVRPTFKAGELVVEKRSQLPKRLKKGRRPSRMFQPVTIPRGLEHELRETFFSHHPWELARPRVILENDGRDGEKWDWSKGIKQPGKPLDGESVVQRQLYLRNVKPPHAFANAHTKDQAERTIVIRNLPKDVTANDLHAFFTECGTAQYVNVLSRREAALAPHKFAELVTDMEAGTESGSIEDLESRTYDTEEQAEEIEKSTNHQDTSSGQDPAFKETIASDSDAQPTPNSEANPDSIIASIRFDTLEQAFAAVQKSGSSIKPSTSPILVRRLAQPPHTLFLTGVPLRITEDSILIQAFKSCGTVSHPHLIRTKTAPHEPTGCGFITLQNPGQVAAAKQKYANHPYVRVYDFPLSHDLCYDMARKEFYKHRHFADIERKVAQEEALSTGAYFTSSPNEIAIPLEDRNYEDWKAWALHETEKAKQAQGSMVTELDNEDAVLDGGEIEEGAQEVADSVPATKEGQTALGGAVMRP